MSIQSHTVVVGWISIFFRKPHLSPAENAEPCSWLHFDDDDDDDDDDVWFLLT